jgi:hypothetical protein
MNNKKLKRREEKEGNNIKKRSKSYTKKGKTEKVSSERISEAAMGGAGRGQGISYFIASAVQWKEKSP